MSSSGSPVRHRNHYSLYTTNKLFTVEEVTSNNSAEIVMGEELRFKRGSFVIRRFNTDKDKVPGSRFWSPRGRNSVEGGFGNF